MTKSVMLAVALTLVAGIGCATTKAADYNKAGFITEVRDGRLWVELAKSVTRVNAGPKGMTLRAADTETLDAYAAAQSSSR